MPEYATCIRRPHRPQRSRPCEVELLERLVRREPGSADPQAASLMFMLVSRRYERRSLIVTSNKPFSKAHRFE